MCGLGLVNPAGEDVHPPAGGVQVAAVSAVARQDSRCWVSSVMLYFMVGLAQSGILVPRSGQHASVPGRAVHGDADEAILLEGHLGDIGAVLLEDLIARGVDRVPDPHSAVAAPADQKLVVVREGRTGYIAAASNDLWGHG